MCGARGVVGEEAAVAVQQTGVFTAANRGAHVRAGSVRAAGVTPGWLQGAQWSRFSHCHRAIEMAKDTVMSSMMVATMEG